MSVVRHKKSHSYFIIVDQRPHTQINLKENTINRRPHCGGVEESIQTTPKLTQLLKITRVHDARPNRCCSKTVEELVTGLREKSRVTSGGNYLDNCIQSPKSNVRISNSVPTPHHNAYLTHHMSVSPCATLAAALSVRHISLQ